MMETVILKHISAIYHSYNGYIVLIDSLTKFTSFRVNFSVVGIAFHIGINNFSHSIFSSMQKASISLIAEGSNLSKKSFNMS